MIKIKHPNKPDVCEWITDEIWNKLKLKQKDYVIMLYEKKFTKEQIMRRLYITNRSSYHNFTSKLRKDLKKCLINYNAGIIINN